MEFTVEGPIFPPGDVRTLKLMAEQRYRVVDIMLLNIKADDSFQNVIAMTAALKGFNSEDQELKNAFRAMAKANNKFAEAILYYIESQQELEKLVTKLENIQ